MKRPLIIVLLPLVISLPSLEAAAAGDKVNFNRDVRPILSDNCFACHGFDAKHRKADLRLDVPEGAFKPNEDGVAAVKPRDLSASSAWQRIITTDEDDLMPPPDSHKKLKPEQREILKRWIEQGAEYQAHWSFIAPVKAEVPVLSDKSKVVSGASGLNTFNLSLQPLDAFILSRLEEKGLHQNAEADRETLIRRVTFDLTGLPP
ncbi:MAG: hypothetical protein RL693_470, partial [Verrucomicrobiota bacterium]